MAFSPAAQVFLGHLVLISPTAMSLGQGCQQRFIPTEADPFLADHGMSTQEHTSFCTQGPEDLEDHADAILAEGCHMPQQLVQSSAQNRGGVPLERLEVPLAGENRDKAIQSP